MTLKKLPLCKNSPNCVSSQASKEDKRHYIAPFKIISHSDKTWEALKKNLNEQPRTVINLEKHNELEAQVKSSLFHFIDDIHFMINKKAKRIDIYSASRVGYSDLGVNRKRIENVRKHLQLLGLIQ